MVCSATALFYQCLPDLSDSLRSLYGMCNFVKRGGFLRYYIHYIR